MFINRFYLCLFVILFGLADISGAEAGRGSLPTNVDLLVETLEEVIDSALVEMDTPEKIPNGAVLIQPQTKHAANWLVDHLLLGMMLRRGFAVTLDSSSVRAEGLRLSYRILELGVIGRSGLWGSSIDRQSRATLAFSMSQGDTLRWQREFPGLKRDRIPKKRVDLLENTSYDFAKTELETRSWSNFVEPVIVSTVLGGLIYLFFSNR